LADYREISQAYAKEGIKAAMLVNGGAAVALLTQLNAFDGDDSKTAFEFALLAWAWGLLFAAVTWMVAFLATRYVDKGDLELDRMRAHLRTSDILMYVGLALVAISFACFIIGCYSIASAFAP
jgi:hypothetical protein